MAWLLSMYPCKIFDPESGRNFFGYIYIMEHIMNIFIYPYMDIDYGTDNDAKEENMWQTFMQTEFKKIDKSYIQNLDDAKSRKICNIHAGVEICAYMCCIIRPPLVLTCCSKGKAPPDTRFANCVKICLQPWSVAWAEGKKIGGPQIGAHFISTPLLLIVEGCIFDKECYFLLLSKTLYQTLYYSL